MMSGVGTFHDRGIDVTKLNDRKTRNSVLLFVAGVTANRRD